MTGQSKTALPALDGAGASMAFQNSVIAVGGMIVQMIVNGVGVAFIAGLTATNRLYGLLEVAATAYGYAMVTYTGQNLGAGKLPRISKGLRAALMISTITSLLIALVMLVLFGRLILSCFISMDAAESMAALDIGYRYLAIMSVFLPILYVLHVTRSCIQGLGNTLLPMVSGIAEFVMRTAAAFLLPAMFGENGILFAEILAWCRGGSDIDTKLFLYDKKVRRTHSCSDCGEKIWKDNHLIKDTVICNDENDTRTHKVFGALEKSATKWILAIRSGWTRPSGNFRNTPAQDSIRIILWNS